MSVTKLSRRTTSLSTLLEKLHRHLYYRAYIRITQELFVKSVENFYETLCTSRSISIRFFFHYCRNFSASASTSLADAPPSFTKTSGWSFHNAAPSCEYPLSPHILSKIQASESLTIFSVVNPDNSGNLFLVLQTFLETLTDS